VTDIIADFVIDSKIQQQQQQQQQQHRDSILLLKQHLVSVEITLEQRLIEYPISPLQSDGCSSENPRPRQKFIATRKVIVCIRN